MDKYQAVVHAQEGMPCPYLQKYEHDAARERAAKVAERLLGKAKTRIDSLPKSSNMMVETLNNGY